MIRLALRNRAANVKKREAANAASRFLWRRRLSACVRVRGAHFEHKFWQF